MSRPANSCFDLLLLFINSTSMKKEARGMETAISANIPDCLNAESQAYSSAWP
jgi:hypothetical protein